MIAPPRPPAAVAVDWNGTMVDDAERAWRATRTALAAVQQEALAPATADAFRAAFELPMDAYFAALGVPADVTGRCVDAWNVAMAESTTTLAPGALQLLSTADALGVPVVVVSGADERVVHGDCTALGLTDLISEVHGNVHPKRRILRRYRSNGPLVYVGDTRYDVAEGLTAGAWTVAVDFGYGSRSDLADAHTIVSDLRDVARLLSGVP
ncbi:HAD family hydrolase [Jiangella endophytica]|uniref:HAD family hydrolase n=1 Tax=Jiangella endophytica TaxID=1623398 RepID=UPI000E348513|nr:HAD family hydrolase [Jiangella endophytica]